MPVAEREVRARSRKRLLWAVAGSVVLLLALSYPASIVFVKQRLAGELSRVGYTGGLDLRRAKFDWDGFRYYMWFDLDHDNELGILSAYWSTDKGRQYLVKDVETFEFAGTTRERPTTRKLTFEELQEFVRKRRAAGEGK